MPSLKEQQKQVVLDFYKDVDLCSRPDFSVERIRANLSDEHFEYWQATAAPHQRCSSSMSQIEIEGFGLSLSKAWGTKAIATRASFAISS